MRGHGTHWTGVCLRGVAALDPDATLGPAGLGPWATRGIFWLVRGGSWGEVWCGICGCRCCPVASGVAAYPVSIPCKQIDWLCWKLELSYLHVMTLAGTGTAAAGCGSRRVWQCSQERVYFVGFRGGNIRVLGTQTMGPRSQRTKYPRLREDKGSAAIEP